MAEDPLPIILLVLLILSAFFSGIEIAFFSLSKAKVHSLVKSRRKGASLLASLKANPDRLLITILIGNNLVNILSSSLATVWATESFGSSGVGIATGAMTMVVLTFGEIIPKTLSTRYAEQIALLAAYPLWMLQIILWPVVIVFLGLLRVVNMFTKVDSNQEVSEDELKAMAHLGWQDGVLEKYERNVIHNVLKLNDKKANSVMTPREAMCMVHRETTLADLVKQMFPRRFSRLPVYADDNEKVVGFVYVRDILKISRSEWGKTAVKDIMREPMYVEENEVLQNVYVQLIKKRVHLAIVCRQGLTVGLITLEDIIEEVLGDIEDETDHVNYQTPVEHKIVSE